MKRLIRLVIILFLASVCLGDTYTSHQKPITDSTLDIGVSSLLWRYIYGDSFTDGTALWKDSALTGFVSIRGDVLTDGEFIISGGTVRSGIWHGTEIDISSYTNLSAGTDITLLGDILNVDDVFLANDADDTTTGTLTAAGFTTTGTSNTDVLIVGSNAPAAITSAGIAGVITWDSDYLYVCIATNSWKRIALSTWGVAGDTMIYENDDVMLFENDDTMLFD